MREEQLRATQGLHPTPALSSWRGHSGRRYIVGIHVLNETALVDVVDAIVIAVRRDDEGTAHMVDIAAVGAHPNEASRERWALRMRERGANEAHIHRLAEGDKERRAIMDDLRQDEAAA